MKEVRLHNCASCVHWNALYESTRAQPNTWNQLECRKHAPIAHEGYDRSVETVWPKTVASDWCGDWKQIVDSIAKETE